MKTLHPEQLRLPLSAFLLIFYASCAASNLFAQETTSANLISGTASISLQVIESQTVDLGNQVTIFNRVVPPVFPNAIPSASPAPTPVLSPAYLQWLQTEEQKTYKLIFLSATIYDHNVTDLRFSDETGSCRVFSDIDFSYFSGIGEFETPDTIYEYILMWGNNTSDALTQDTSDQATLGWLTTARQQLPNLSLFPSSQSGYLVATAPPSGSDALTALNDIHAYYDAHHVRLIAEYQQRAVAWAAEQAWAAAHPPGPPPPIIINFWPIKNSRYLSTGTVTTGTGGNNQ